MKSPRSKGENHQQTQPTYDAGSGNRTQDTLVGGERSGTTAPPLLPCINMIQLGLAVTQGTTSRAN